MQRLLFLSVCLSLAAAVPAPATNAVLQRQASIRDYVAATAVDEAGSVYVAQGALGLVKRNSRGRDLWRMWFPEDFYPYLIVPGSFGKVFMLGSRSGRNDDHFRDYMVVGYDATGVDRDSWGGAHQKVGTFGSYPAGAGTDEAGRLYATFPAGFATNDYVNGRFSVVWGYGHHSACYTPDGRLLWEHRTLTSFERSSSAFAMAVNPLGGMASLNSTSIEARSAAGELLWSRNSSQDDPAYDLRSPGASGRQVACYDRSNHLYIAGVFQGGQGYVHGVRKFAPDGTLLWFTASHPPVNAMQGAFPVDLRVDENGSAYMGFNLPTACGTNGGTYFCETTPAVIKIAPTGDIGWISRIAQPSSVTSELAGIDLDAGGRSVIAAKTSRKDDTGTGFLFGILDSHGNQFPGRLTEKRSSDWIWKPGPPSFDTRGSINLAVDKYQISTGKTLHWFANYKPFRFRHAPQIQQAPASQTNQVGADVTLNVHATGKRRLRYQWRFNGQNITGATKSTLLLENVQPAQAGDYSVEVRNPFGTIVTPEARLVLTP